jgi:hypothetical protein
MQKGHQWPRKSRFRSSVHTAVQEHKALFGVQTMKRNSEFAWSFPNVAMGSTMVEESESCSRVYVFEGVGLSIVELQWPSSIVIYLIYYPPYHCNRLLHHSQSIQMSTKHTGDLLIILHQECFVDDYGSALNRYARLGLRPLVAPSSVMKMNVSHVS